MRGRACDQIIGQDACRPLVVVPEPVDPVIARNLQSAAVPMLVGIRSGQFDKLIEERVDTGISNEESEATRFVRRLRSDVDKLAPPPESVKLDNPGIISR